MEGTDDATSQFAIETCTDSTEWNAFLDRHDGPVYARWGWGEAVETYGIDRWHLVVRERSTGDIVGALPLYHVESRLFGSQLLSPAFAERGSATVDESQPDRVREMLLSHATRLGTDLGVDVVTLRGSAIDGTEPFVEKNRYVTFQNDVDRHPDAVWADLKDSRQRQVEQADDDPTLQFGVGTTLDDLREYYRLYLESMRGHGSPPHSFAFFETLWNHFAEDGTLRLSTVHRDGALINGMIDLALGSTVYQWGVITDYEHRDLNGGSLLLWKSLAWAAENGYDTYEFGRTREGSGVYMFKKSFGGSKTWYDDLHYFPGEPVSLPNPDDETYDRAKAVWRRLPLSVTRVVGPRIRKRIGL